MVFPGEHRSTEARLRGGVTGLFWHVLVINPPRRTRRGQAPPWREMRHHPP